MESLQKILDALKGLPFLVKIILALPALDIVWGLYRICASVVKKNIAGIVINIILLFVPIMWIIDIVVICLKGDVWSLD